MEIQTLPAAGSPQKFQGKTSNHERNIAIADGVTKNGERKLNELNTLTERMKDAMQALDQACNSFKRETAEWMDTDLPKALSDLRQLRFAMTAEFTPLLKQLSELRAFFLGSDYKTEVERLREFVELCERLQQLKASGFLDTVADTMLRLAIHE